jgi:hypothetical protein
VARPRGSCKSNEGEVLIIISKFGKVEQNRIDAITEIMQECYKRLQPHSVDLVDLYLFERSSSMEAFLTKEREEVGVASSPFDELFFAMHDAWRGIPRIVLCFEKMKKVPRLVAVGGIRHEVGHSVLHGSLRYYVLPLPKGLRELADRYGFSSEYATDLLYLVSVAVKDYEVSKLLYERGYKEDLATYVKYMLTISESDLFSWRIARNTPLAEIMCLISCLKAASCAIPLLNDEIHGSGIKHCLSESVSYFPENLSSRILRLIVKSFPSFGTDTLDNIDEVTNRCKSIFRAVFSQ